MTTIGPSKPATPPVRPDTIPANRGSDNVAEAAPTARPAVDNGKFAAPVPQARVSFQRDALTVLPPVRQPGQTQLTGPETTRQNAEARRDPAALRAEASAVNGETGPISRFSTPLRPVVMRDNASETLARHSPEEATPTQKQGPATVPPSPSTMAALLSHLPSQPKVVGRPPRRNPDDPDYDPQAEEEADEAEAQRQASLGRVRISRRV